MRMARTRWSLVGGVLVLTLAALAWTFLRSDPEPEPPPGPLPTPLAWTAQIDLLAGDGVGGLQEGAGAQARFADPYGVAVGTDGVVYVADAGDNNRIRRL